MLSQLEFKLSVEKQYKEGIEKMAKLYQLEGDRKSRQDAENKRIESNQKIQLLKQALKRYEDLHVDMDFGEEADGMSPARDNLEGQGADWYRRQYQLSKYSPSFNWPVDNPCSCCEGCGSCYYITLRSRP
ncbi:Serine/threonine kinase [Maublancomyces gigas]|uniref:Serine/threonine kinase n=1 Tax=Discina gigas TaxID=1032678 RepID=A0ABR3GDG9_9PEZI